MFQLLRDIANHPATHFLLAIWLILILIIGDSFLGGYLFVAAAAILLIFLPLISKQKILLFKTEIILWFIFLVLVLISVLFSVNQSVSFYFFTTLLLAFHCWLIASLVDFPDKIKDLWPLMFMGTVGVLSILAIIFTLFSANLGEKLPGFNIFYATYGHNHLAALLLMALPVSWFIAEKHHNKFAIILPFTFSILLILCLGRIAWIISFFQLFVLFFVFAKLGKISDKLFRLGKLIGGSMAIILLLATLAFGWRSIDSDNLTNCLNYSKNNQSKINLKICSSIKEEPRGNYWNHALKMIKEKPLFGFGIGTYRFASRKFLQNPRFFASNTHNEFLQSYAEVGIIGGSVFLILMMLMLIRGWRVALRRKNLQLIIIMIAVTSSYINAFFDFDWHFIGIFVITLVMLSLVIRQEKSNDNKKINLFFILIVQWLIILFFSIYILLAGLFLASDYLFARQRPELVYKMFPLNYLYTVVFAKQLPQPMIGELLISHANNGDALIELYDRTNEVQQKILIIGQLAKVDPWPLATNSKYLEELLNDKNTDTANWLYSWTTNFLSTKIEAKQFQIDEISWGERQKFIEIGFLLVEHQLGDKDYEKTGLIWQQIRVFDEYALANKNVFQKLTAQDCSQIQAIISLKNIPTKYFGENNQHLSDGALNFVNICSLGGEQIPVAQLLKFAKDRDGIDAYGFWQDFSLSVGGQIKHDIKIDLFSNAIIRANMLFETWRFLNSNYSKNSLDGGQTIEAARVIQNLADELKNTNDPQLKSQVDSLEKMSKEMLPAEFSF